MVATSVSNGVASFGWKSSSAIGVLTVMTDPEQFQRLQEGALERGQVFQDAEGRRTRDPGAGAENAESEADRNAEHLACGVVGPGVPED